METLVLCPEELCLGPMRLTASGIVGLTPSASDFRCVFLLSKKIVILLTY